MPDKIARLERALASEPDNKFLKEELANAYLRVNKFREAATLISEQVAKMRLGQARDARAIELGRLLHRAGAEPLIAERTETSGLISVPGYTRRQRITATYGFNYSFCRQYLWRQEPNFHVLYNRHYDHAARALPRLHGMLHRWHLTSDSGLPLHYIGNSMYFLEGGPPGYSRERSDIAFINSALWGALPEDNYSPEELRQQSPDIVREILGDRRESLFYLFLADLFINDLARFPDQMPENQAIFIEARRRRGQEEDLEL